MGSTPALDPYRSQHHVRTPTPLAFFHFPEEKIHPQPAYLQLLTDNRPNPIC
jgi:hypothetical protein